MCPLLILSPTASWGETVTFSGNVSYSGSYIGDTLYVSVVDTTSGGGANFLTTQAIHTGTVPFDVPYSLSFDNAGTSAFVVILAFLDVDGSTDWTHVDVTGWYGDSPVPELASSASSQGGLDFFLPTAEIHGEIFYLPGMGTTDLIITPDPLGAVDVMGSILAFKTDTGGPYAIVGIYEGTYCVHALAGGVPAELYHLCYDQDMGCTSPTPIAILDGEIITGIDFDYPPLGVEKSSWGEIKSIYK
jgi:hypothetical protein